MKVLFLDVDGVMNSQVTLQRAQRSGSILGIDAYMAFLVGKIQLDTDCEIVLSSSWRHMPDGLKEVKSRFTLYGVTPDLQGKTDRGCEVIAWLEEHPEVTRHAILDDNADFHKEQPLFKTSFATGLTEEIAAKVTLYLNKLGEIEEYILGELESSSECCYGYNWLQTPVKTRKILAPAIKHLKELGFIEFHRGLMTEEGEVAGSGWCRSELGNKYVEAHELWETR